MRVIQKRKNYLAILTGMGLSLCMLILIVNIKYKTTIKIIFGILVVLTILLGILWIREHKKSKIAELIEENKFIHLNEKGNEVMVSYFGILRGSTVIKFSQDHIRLMAMEIASNSISLTYGTDKGVQKTLLTCQIMDQHEIRRIADSFKHETGITAKIIDGNKDDIPGGDQS